MNKDNQIPIDFYYQEVFNSLIKYAASTQKIETGIPLRMSEANSMRRKFIDRIKRENTSPEDCLKTLYSIALIHNGDLPIPNKKSEVKKSLINKLTRDYLKSEYFQFTDSEFQIRNQLNIDFPNYASFDDSALEGKKGKSDSSVQKIEGLFFETYDNALKRNSYFKKHPISRKTTVRRTQKNVRYKAPLGTKQKIILAGLAIATAAQLTSIAPSPNTHSIEAIHQNEPQEIVQKNPQQSSEQIALQHLYSNPSSLSKLGIHNDICEQFAQYV